MKIVIGGQIDKEVICKMVTSAMPRETVVDVKSDLDAAMALSQGQYDYYIGACNTGGGGALAMAMAIVGATKCVTLSMPGNIMSEQEIVTEMNSGKIAFGFTAQDKEQIIPIICQELTKKV